MQIVAHFALQFNIKSPVKETIILFDDLLTNGTHFKACKRLIQERLPDHAVIDLFIGRAKRPDVFSDFDVIEES